MYLSFVPFSLGHFMLTMLSVQFVYLFTVLVSCVLGASITTDLQNGICLCINEANVKAVRDPHAPSSQIAFLSNGACFLSNGGIYHSNDETYYELVDMSNGQKGWVDSFYLNAYMMNVCNSTANSTRLQYHTPSGQASNCSVQGTQYIHGQGFNARNMECICDDGLVMCSLGGKPCFSGGIVYKDNQRFAAEGRSCDCKQGVVTCTSPPSVGK